MSLNIQLPASYIFPLCTFVWIRIQIKSTRCEWLTYLNLLKSIGSLLTSIVLLFLTTCLLKKVAAHAVCEGSRSLDGADRILDTVWHASLPSAFHVHWPESVRILHRWCCSSLRRHGLSGCCSPCEVSCHGYSMPRPIHFLGLGQWWLANFRPLTVSSCKLLHALDLALAYSS